LKTPHPLVFARAMRVECQGETSAFPYVARATEGLMVGGIEHVTAARDRSDVINHLRRHLGPASYACAVLGVELAVVPLPTPGKAEKEGPCVDGPLVGVVPLMRRRTRVIGTLLAPRNEARAPRMGARTRGAARHQWAGPSGSAPSVRK
jgi:hypothetical protein